MRTLKIKQALTLLLLTFLPAASSAEWGECANDCSSFPRLDVGVEFLYWKPCKDDLDYAMTSDTIVSPVAPTGSGNYHYLHPHASPGVRASIGKTNLLLGWNFFFEYTYFSSSACDHVLRPPPAFAWTTKLHPAQSFAGTQVSADWSLHYQTFDFIFSTNLDFGNCEIVPFFGPRLLFLGQDFDTEATSLAEAALIGFSEYESDCFGVGLIAGSEISFNLMENLKIFTMASVSLIDMEDKNSYTSVQQVVDIDANEVVAASALELSAEERFLLPGFHLAAGLRYSQTICGIQLAIEGGYEFLEWHNAPNSRVFLDAGNNLALGVSSNDSTLGMHGVFAGFDIRF